MSLWNHASSEPLFETEEPKKHEGGRIIRGPSAASIPERIKLAASPSTPDA
jgi:hypothetical protein